MRARVMSVAIAVVAVVVLVGGVVALLSGVESPGCDDRGRCHGLRDGTPVDSADVAGQVAGLAIDSDPSPGFTSRCSYRGTADEVDVYRCRVRGGADGRLVLHLEHPRGSPWYRYLVVEQRHALSGTGSFRGERGDCALTSSPTCPLWSAYGKRLARALSPRQAGDDD